MQRREGHDSERNVLADLLHFACILLYPDGVLTHVQRTIATKLQFAVDSLLRAASLASGGDFHMQAIDAYWGRRALDYVDAIEASKTSASVLSQFEKMIGDLGFHAYIMAGVPAPGSRCSIRSWPMAGRANGSTCMPESSSTATILYRGTASRL